MPGNPASLAQKPASTGIASIGNMAMPRMTMDIPQNRAPIANRYPGMMEYRKGGKVAAKPKRAASKAKASSASKRGDGIASKGKTKGRMY